jgi:aminoglycoside 3-N-acetyltransferase I
VSINDNISIRRLQPGDIDMVRSLNELYACAFDDPENYLQKPPSPTYVKDLLSNNTTVLLVALTEAREVVGGLTSYILPKPEQNRSEMYVYDLAVAKQFRREKIASRMLSHADKIGRSQGCHITFVQADYEDEPAVRLYTSLGIREEVLHFDLTKLQLHDHRNS